MVSNVLFEVIDNIVNKRLKRKKKLKVKTWQKQQRCGKCFL